MGLQAHRGGFKTSSFPRVAERGRGLCEMEANVSFDAPIERKTTSSKSGWNLFLLQLYRGHPNTKARLGLNYELREKVAPSITISRDRKSRAPSSFDGKCVIRGFRQQQMIL